MRIPIYIAALCGISALIGCESPYQKEREQISAALDSLNTVILSNHLRVKDVLYDVLGDNYMNYGAESDSILETHRINWTTIDGMVWLIRLKKDSTVDWTYKNFTVKNPLTQEGRFEILNEKYGAVSLDQFKLFRKKLSEVSFYDATTNVDYMCCFGSGSVSWEANIAGRRHTHYTHCSQSKEFIAACGIMMQVTNNQRVEYYINSLYKE